MFFTDFNTLIAKAISVQLKQSESGNDEAYYSRVQVQGIQFSFFIYMPLQFYDRLNIVIAEHYYRTPVFINKSIFLL